MSCRGYYRWSLSDLVGAFVDLAIAYLFLCASALAYAVSKLLGFFGLRLRCPCTVLGTIPFSNYCVGRLLVDYPTEKVSNVLLSVRSRFPFKRLGVEARNEGEGSCSSVSDVGKRAKRLNDSVVGEGGVDVKEKGVMNERPGGLEARNEGEGSCSSASDVGKRAKRLDDSVVGEGGFDMKEKGDMNERARGLLPPRKRHPSPASCDSLQGDLFGCCSSLSDSIGKGGGEMVEDVIGHSDNAIDAYYVDSNQASRVTILGKRDSSLADECPDENDEEEKLSSSMVGMAEPSKKFTSSCGDEHAIKILEQALRKEQAACSALYIELEKERSAAASAADEAISMIMHLQEEKAKVEMEARQYQRIIEEKFAYDAEEMNVLKDIILIREREKHSLLEEVEEYRHMIDLFNEEDADEFEKRHISPLVDQSEDSVFGIGQPSASWIDEKSCLKDMQTSLCSRIREQNVQEKEIIPVCGHLYVPSPHDQSQLSTTKTCESSRSQELNLSEKRIHVLGEESIQDGQDFLQDKMDFFGTTDAHFPRRENLEKQNVGSFDEVKKSVVVMFDKEPQVHDIHVIDDEPGLPDAHKRRQHNNHW